MGLFESIRAARTPADRARTIVDAVRHTEDARLRLYLDEQDVDDQFLQRRGPLDEVVTSDEVAGEISAGYLTFFGMRGSRRTTESARIELTPLVKAFLLEAGARESGSLVDLALNDPRAGPLLYHLGAGRIFPSQPYESVTAVPDLGLDENAAAELERERTYQAQAFGSGHGAIVWAGRGTKTLACIATSEHADAGSVVSYRASPPYGLLGIRERSFGDLDLIKPLFLWHEAEPSKETELPSSRWQPV